MAKRSSRTRAKLQRAIVPLEVVERKIFLIRGEQVMLSPHLAELYEVEPRALMQAVKRNPDRFPEDFMFHLNASEYENLKSQIVISSWGGVRHAPYAFTEQGIAMLSSVLKGERAAYVNVGIMRAFIKIGRMLMGNPGLAEKIAALERKYDKQFQLIFDILRQFTPPKSGTKGRPIGFVPVSERLK